MSDLRKAAVAALEALKNTVEYLPVHFDDHFEAIEVLKAALAQPEQEPDESFCDTHCTWHDHHPDCLMAQPVQVPVAWLRHRDSCLALNDAGLFGSDWTPLYAHPPQRKPLTEDKISEIAMDCSFVSESDTYFARAIEKAHGIE
jgi:hypothetical protein